MFSTYKNMLSLLFNAHNSHTQLLFFFPTLCSSNNSLRGVETHINLSQIYYEIFIQMYHFAIWAFFIFFIHTFSSICMIFLVLKHYYNKIHSKLAINSRLGFNMIYLNKHFKQWVSHAGRQLTKLKVKKCNLCTLGKT